MVNDVAKLTQSIRDGVARQRARTSLQQMPLAEKQRLRDQLNSDGTAIYTDKNGNRFRIERKPA